jgi:hypothetical protein
VFSLFKQHAARRILCRRTDELYPVSVCFTSMEDSLVRRVSSGLTWIVGNVTLPWKISGRKD